MDGSTKPALKKKGSRTKTTRKSLDFDLPPFLAHSTESTEGPEPDLGPSLLPDKPLDDLLENAARPRTPPPRRSKTPPRPPRPEPTESAGFAGNIERRVLLALYNEFFDPPLSDRHARPRKNWTEETPLEDIKKEVFLLQQITTAVKPTVTLSNLWVSFMGAVETVGAATGTPLHGLAAVSRLAAQQPEADDTFRSLLLKYPVLRGMISMSDYPELKLFFLSMSVIDVTLRSNANNNLPTKQQ